MKLQTLNTAITIETATAETTDGNATREAVILLTTSTDTNQTEGITAVLNQEQAQQLADYLTAAIKKHVNGGKD